jgi:hypothetical protein
MSFLVSLKVVRLLLAVCVSVWLAGGCLLGCGNMAMAAQSDEQSSEAAVEGASCHTAQAHHCCSAKPAKQARPAKQPLAKQAKIDSKLTESYLALSSMPRGMMNDCPLAMRGTVITSKASSNAPDSDHATSAQLPLSNGNGELAQKHVVAPLVPNRGPTYLRCCVFLI